jgi:RNA recognition motif-containing protein
MNIYVANLSFDIQDEDLKELFTPYGEVSSAKVIMDKITSRSRGFGFVEMADETAGRKAITELDGTMVQQRSIKVNEAKPKEEKSYGGGGGRDSSRGGYGRDNFNNANSYNKNRY